MIAYIPKLYPDELIYSFLSRLAVHNGYMTYRQAAEDIFGSKLVNPSIEFIDLMRPEVNEALTVEMNMKEIILAHTMFPYYATFLDEKKKMEALNFLQEGNKGFYKKLPIPKWNEERFLRYCPLCVENDRKIFGETYWHRLHQMWGINVCCKHGCMLLNSDVAIKADKTPEFVSANAPVKSKHFPVYGNETEILLAKYAGSVFENTSTIPETNIAEFLNNKLEGTAYLSARGAVRKLADLSSDFVEYYQGTGGLQLQDTNTYRSRIKKILNGKRIHFLEICQLAMFLEINPMDLVERRSSVGTSSQNYSRSFDKRVLELLKNGVGVNEAARQLSVSSKTIRDIKDGKYASEYISVRGKGGRNRFNWNKIDKETLPLVKLALEELKEKAGERPVRITNHTVTRKMNLPDKYFMNLPMCRDEIKRYEVSFEEYWAREVEWVMLRIQKENLELNWKQLRYFTNLNRKNFQRCLPYLKSEFVKEICKNL